MKNKISTLFFVDRPEIENKWWHRLFNVLLGGSTIAVFILALLMTVSNFNTGWVTYNLTAAKSSNLTPVLTLDELEGNIDALTAQNAPRDQIQAYVDLYTKESDGSFKLKNAPDTAMSITNTIQQAQNMGANSDAILNQIESHNPGTPIAQSIAKARSSGASSDMIVQEIIKQNSPVPPTLTDIKNASQKHIHLGFILSDIFLWILVPLVSVILWIILWSSVVYRSILYVKFGKTKVAAHPEA